MKNVAVLTVQFDTVAERFEIDLIYADRINGDVKDVYISSSPKVDHIVTKIAVGKEAIAGLEKLQTAYQNKNEKLKLARQKKRKTNGSNSTHH